MKTLVRLCTDSRPEKDYSVERRGFVQTEMLFVLAIIALIAAIAIAVHYVCTKVF